MLTDNQDAYGHLLSDYYDGKADALVIVEREDGLIMRIILVLTSLTIPTGQNISSAR